MRRCFIPLFYIKPQLIAFVIAIVGVVLYLCSTSNHNLWQSTISLNPLFYTFVLHQTTTIPRAAEAAVVLYLCSTSNHNLRTQNVLNNEVVLYLCSTSNHNCRSCCPSYPLVVLYLCSTSNHNHLAAYIIMAKLFYTFVLHQTTTTPTVGSQPPTLFYTFVLHQTTTKSRSRICSLSLFYTFVLHQTTTKQWRNGRITGCFIPLFYIKPQPP